MTKTIQSLGVRTDYLNARELTKSRGMELISNPLLDGILAKGKERTKIKQIERDQVKQWWTDSILVCLPKEMQFRAGKDVVDIHTDTNGRRFALPGSYISEEVLATQVTNPGLRIGIIVEPEAIETGREKIFIHPLTPRTRLVKGISSPVQAFRLNWDNSLLPLTEPDSFGEYIEGKMRILVTHFGPTVRPIVRGIGFGGGRWTMDASCRTDGEYGVIGVS